jgi:hypothetical protein
MGRASRNKEKRRAMGGGSIPFSKQQSGVAIVGQPFTIVSVGVPMNVKLTCNCGGPDTEVLIVGSVAAACPSCRKLYNALFNPQNGQIQMSVGLPAPELIPS